MHLGDNTEKQDKGRVSELAQWLATRCPPGFDFNTDEILPAPSDPRWSIPVRVSFDGAEGEGRVWLMVDDKDDSSEPWIAIEGKANARRLAALLLAWAGEE